MSKKKAKQEKKPEKQEKKLEKPEIKDKISENKENKPLESNYYDLKTDAVERLVNSKNAPEVSDKEIEKYTNKKKFHMPSLLKVVLLKFWFAGAVCYFVMWGLGMMISGLDLMVVLAIALGIVNDLMVNHVIRHFEAFPGAGDKYMMFTSKKFWTFFLNIIYCSVILFFIVQTYNIVNTLLVGDASTAESVPIGVEPILFGLLFVGFDTLFIKIKKTFIKVFKDADAKVSKASNKNGVQK